MIAANDPQEYIPGGRQQAKRHPDPPERKSYGIPQDVGDDFLLHRLERVKLDENAASEWWTLRKSVPTLKSNSALGVSAIKNDANTRNARESAKSFLTPASSPNETLFNDSWTPRSVDLSKRRISDITASRIFAHKRFSSESERSPAAGGRTPQASGAKDRVEFRSPEESMEEEMYVRGNLVVWSRGLSYGEDDKARTVICSYSSHLPLCDAVWCTFQMENHDLEEHAQLVGARLDCLCIADTQNLRVYTKDDEDFVATLPFQVKKMWPTSFGVFIERDDAVDLHRDARPLVYSLSHPLDIAAPVAFSKAGHVKVIQEENFKIVFSSESLDLCMIYDGDAHQHVVCRCRRLKSDEMEMFNKTNLTPSMSNTKNITAGHSVTESYRSMFPIASPFSRPGSVTSTRTPLDGPNTGSFYTSSRCNTPAMSPCAKKAGSPWIQRYSRLYGTMKSNDSAVMNRFPNADVTACNALPALPAYSLEQAWAEHSYDSSVNSAATKVFVTRDLMGRSYLCYLVASRSQLSILKFDYSNNSDDIVFGKDMSISAKDAVTIPHLHMLAILEHTSNVVLYSGLTVVGKLHIGGALAQHVPSPYAVRKHARQFFSATFPKRSSLLPTSTPSDPRFDEHLLSPVGTPSRQNANIIQMPEIGDVRVVLAGLKDAVDSRLTLQYSDGSCYRVTLPSLVRSPLVEDCLSALRAALPRDLVMTTLARWYATRNLPGSGDVSHAEEWAVFVKMIYELLGYACSSAAGGECRGGARSAGEHTPCSAQVKRQRQSSEGSAADWNYLRGRAGREMDAVGGVLQFAGGGDEAKRRSCFQGGAFAKCAGGGPGALFSHVRIVHYVLHLVYEDLKLNILRKHDLPLLASFLCRLSADLSLARYTMHYWKDFPAVVELPRRDDDVYDPSNVARWACIPDEPTSVLAFLHRLCASVVEAEDEGAAFAYPIVEGVNARTKNVVLLLATYLRSGVGEKAERFLSVVAPPGSRGRGADACEQPAAGRAGLTSDTPSQKMVLRMIDMGITTRELETFPLAVNFVLYGGLWRCRQDPPADWPAEAYNLLQRHDLAAQSDIIASDRSEGSSVDAFGDRPTRSQPAVVDGMEDMDSDVLRFRFAKDQRVREARNLLQSSRPVAISVAQRPDVSDHDHLEEQEKQLYALCTRTMALPVGRGMLTLHTATPCITEPLPVPPLCLAGRATPRGTTVELTHIDTPANMARWPQFHNGVANGLRIGPTARHVDSTWIVFNKPKPSAADAGMEHTMEHAGFLMALGLNGHLRSLDVLNRFDYLAKVHEMTSVGVLLGLGATFRGTSNQAVTKTLSVHVEGLLPPTSMELDVPQNLQVASLLGLGLVYQGTAHRRMIEVMLAEIGRPPGPEMENSVDRQSYSLAAGLALGLITLRQGGSSVGLSDLKVPDTLHYYMVGGSKRPLGGTQKEKYKVPSFQIREGATVNLDVTAPGATLALGLMYLGTGNKAIAGWMAPPDTHYLLDFVRPDFLMLRTLCRALILWDDIVPEKAWVEAQVPDSIRPYCMVEPDPHCDLDYEAMNQAYCNIIAGACFAVGLKYAGTAEEAVFDLLHEYCHMFGSLISKTIAELAGRPTMETCLNVVLVSLAMVMAGTGNLDVIRMVRYLRQRVGLASSAVVTYGSHMALHMALGLLFLGGGRQTLSNSPASVAALVCAFYPKFPTHSNDNRYHLQAFRHLYVLAAEPRLVIPTDIFTGRMCYAWLDIVKLDGKLIYVNAPTLIPDLGTLSKITVYDVRYWPVVFERERNWDQLLKLLGESGQIDVMQRAGCLSYVEDKTGFRTELARTLTKSYEVPWDPPAKSIIAFSSDAIVKLFADQFLGADARRSRRADGDDGEQDAVEAVAEETRLRHALTKFTYESVIKDKLAALPLFVQLIEIVKNLASTSTPIDVWNLKIVHAFVLKNEWTFQLTNNEQLLALHQKALTTVDNWEASLWEALRAYVTRRRFVDDCDEPDRLAKYVAFYGIPHGVAPDDDAILQVVAKLQGEHGCDAEGIDKVLRILGHLR